MEKDFHYAITYAAAKLTQCEHPDLIAYACQFVDDNNEGQFSIEGENIFFPEKIPSDGGHYYPIMTQSLSPKSFDIYVQKYVYLPFHFLPGDNNVEIDRKKNPLSTTPNSANAQSLVDAALKSNNPYLIGIALHTYADTWAHENFTGIQETWNSVYPWYNVFKSIAPNIGHAEAGHSPDVISEVWTDHRLGRTVNNAQRALVALEKMYTKLHVKTGHGPQWSEVAEDFGAVIMANTYQERINKVDDLINDNGGGALPTYRKNVWIDAALDLRGNTVVMKSDFEGTHWYNFHQAGKKHFAKVLDLIKEI